MHVRRRRYGWWWRGWRWSGFRFLLIHRWIEERCNSFHCRGWNVSSGVHAGRHHRFVSQLSCQLVDEGRPLPRALLHRSAARATSATRAVSSACGRAARASSTFRAAAPPIVRSTSSAFMYPFGASSSRSFSAPPSICAGSSFPAKSSRTPSTIRA